MENLNTDAPNAAQEPVVHPAKPLWWFDYVHYSLVVLVAPLFLFSVLRVLMYRGSVMVPPPGWPEALMIAFFIGLFIRKERAYIAYPFFIIISVFMEAFLIVRFSRWQHTVLMVLVMIWFGLILLSASICGLTCRRQRNSRVSNEKVEP